MSSVAKIQSETGWDALAEELPMVVRVMAGPATLEDLAEVAGEQDLVRARKRISRLVREGVVVCRNDHFEAPAKMIDTDRQEGILTTIARVVIPVLMKIRNEPKDSLCLQVDLDLDEADQEVLCADGQQGLIDDLNELSDRPAAEKQPYTLIVIGTSDVPPAGPPAERALETLRRSARQRSDPSASSRAVIRRYDAHLGHPSEAEALVRRAAEKAGAKSPGSRFTLFYGFCANERDDGEHR